MENTVIVVGAGASKEFGLPTGDELKSKIAQICDIRYDDFGSRLVSGNLQLVNAVRAHVQDKKIGDGSINPYLRAGWNIRDNMPLAPSIDNFLETHQLDHFIVHFGKIAISLAILEAEKSSIYQFDWRRPDSKPDFPTLSQTWIGRLFSILVSERNFSSFLEALSSITFVSFNYDRCIHHFFYLASQQYFSLSSEQVREVKDAIRVIYTYGSVGGVEPGQMGVSSFGASEDWGNLLDRASGIRTFTEGADSESRLAIGDAMKDATCCIFMGFGYLPLNMELLFQRQRVECRRVIGTAKGLSSNSTSVLRDELKSIFGKEFGDGTWQPIGDLNVSLLDQTCTGLMHEFHRFLSDRLASA